MGQIYVNDLSVFIRVTTTNSFSAAARELNIAPKTVSKQIARLEQTLGVTLFERNTRHLRITDEGLAILDKAQKAVDEITQLREIAGNQENTPSGVIRLTAPAPFGQKYVASAIADFCRQYPAVSFDLRLSDQIDDLYRSNLDLAIRIGELHDSRLVAKRIADNRRILTASPDYLRAHGSPKTPEQLAEHRCLLFAYPGLYSKQWQLTNGKRQLSVDINSDFSSDSGDVLRLWCLAGMGIALRETWDVGEEIASGRLIRLLPDWQAIPSKISLVRLRRAYVPQRLRVFMDFLQARWQNVL